MIYTNGQKYNTPVVIYTVGNSRVLHWRKRLTKLNERGNRTWVVDESSYKQMMLDDGSLCIINPNDECPHWEKMDKADKHWQHGNTFVKKKTLGFAFVVRVSPHLCKCNIHTNRVILDEDVMEIIKKKEKKKER